MPTTPLLSTSTRFISRGPNRALIHLFSSSLRCSPPFFFLFFFSFFFSPIPLPHLETIMKGRHLRGLFHRNSSQTEPHSPSPSLSLSSSPTPAFLPPPPYSRGNNVSPVVVRLRVWHIHELGWHPQFNDQLAKLLRDDVPKDWVARPAPKPQYNDSSGRDIFVPVEVGISKTSRKRTIPLLVARHSQPTRDPPTYKDQANGSH